MVKRHYVTGALVVLSLIGGSAVASAAEIGNSAPNGYAAQHAAYQVHRPAYEYRGLYNYAAPPVREGYGFYPYYDGRWDPYTWSTGNGYY